MRTHRRCLSYRSIEPALSIQLNGPTIYVRSVGERPDHLAQIALFSTPRLRSVFESRNAGGCSYEVTNRQSGRFHKSRLFCSRPQHKEPGGTSSPHRCHQVLCSGLFRPAKVAFQVLSSDLICRKMHSITEQEVNATGCFWPKSAVRLRIAGCRRGKATECHDRPQPPHCRR